MAEKAGTPRRARDAAASSSKGARVAQRNRFGTFGGVFTPSILTIMGVVMFMRANFVVGQAGILGALIVLVVAKSISLLTTLSVAAISTNTRVHGGGSYYLISRSLGPEFGGSIGIAYFCALALSVPFYILGFTEAMIRSVPQFEPHALYISLGTAAVLFAIAFVGAGWAIKTQYVIMTFLFLAIVAFVGGQLTMFSRARFVENLAALTPGSVPDVKVLSFWVVFAIYFPAVTGVDAGLNMSGDLEEPGRSIPRGMLAAVGVGFTVYLVQILLGGGAYSRSDMLETPFELLKNNALFGAGILVVLGVFAATLSSALGSYLGAPRVLQAVSRDRIVKSFGFFAKGSVKGDEPRRALALAGLVTVAVILLASKSANALNAVAPVITMFFLYTYGMMNAAAFVEAIGDNPSFRPRFRLFHWATAGLGALGCAATAMLISPVAAAVAMGVVVVFYWRLRSRHLQAQFGDARRGWFFTAAMRNLRSLAGTAESVKDWRPTPLVFAGNPDSRKVLMRYAVWLEAGHGIIMPVNVLEGKAEDYVRYREPVLKQLTESCAGDAVHSFPVVMVAEDRDQGVRAVLQTASVGPVRPNMAVFGWAEEPGRVQAYGRHLALAASLGMSLVLIRGDRELPRAEEAKRVDVWWRGRKNGGLMLLLAHLLTTNREWANSEVRLLRMVDNADGREPAKVALGELATEARLVIKPEVIVSERPFNEVLHENSHDATCVFLGFDLPGVESGQQTGRKPAAAGKPPGAGDTKEDEEGKAKALSLWHASVSEMVQGLPTTILTSSLGGEDVTA